MYQQASASKEGDRYLCEMLDHGILELEVALEIRV